MLTRTERAWVLPREKRSARDARRRLEATCADAPPERLDDARLLVTELVSNALLHSAGPVRLVLSRATGAYGSPSRTRALPCRS